MSDHRIVFEVHKAVFKSKIEIFRRYAEELESKFQSDLKRIETEFDFEIEDEDYISYIESLLDEKRMVEQDFINQYRRSTIVSIYSLLEHRLSVVADLLGRLKRSNLKISDLSGDGIVRNKKYLEKVCNVDFSKLNQEWSVIMDMNSLRNCIVHCEGDVSKSRSLKKLSNIIKNTDGLRLEPDDTLVCELPYLEKIIDVAENFFSGTVDASFQVFKAYNNSSQRDALKRA